MTTKSNAEKIAGQFRNEAKRTKKDFGYLLGSLVEVVADSVAEKGIARKGAIPPNQQYATVYKGVPTIKSITRPVDRRGRLKSVFNAFATFVQYAESYTMDKNGMSGRVYRMANATAVKWASNSAKIGFLENGNISKFAKRPIAGVKPSLWQDVVAKYPRRFISKRFNPARRSVAKALEEWGKTFAVNFGKSKPPRKAQKIKLPGE